MSRVFKSTKTDSYPTATSEEQAQVEYIISQHRPTGQKDEAKPPLHKNTHLQYLVRNFSQGFPARFVSQDASQPWLAFWTIQSFYLIGAALDPVNKQRCIDTIMACQHPGGGFSGGPGQFPHLLPTYAAVSALAVVGRPGPGGGWDQIDRKKIYDFFLSLKQPDGSFLVARDSEVDVRGIYCLLCVAVMLNLMTPELISGTAGFIASLQTYEGGFASASHPYFSGAPSPETLLDSPRPALGEAHGGYTYCALASWVLLKPLLSFDATLKTRSDDLDIDLKKLTRWLVNLQGSEIELGGFRGRTNKLVDACYSWWVAGCFPLLRSLGVGVNSAHLPNPYGQTAAEEEDEQWDDFDDNLFNRAALQEYILYAAQHPSGGLRDKPPKISDAYHTLYSLSGMSTAQHTVVQSKEMKDKLQSEWRKPEGNTTDDELQKITFLEARTWKEDEGATLYVNGAGDRLNATHPIFNLTMTHVREILNHFYKQE